MARPIVRIRDLNFSYGDTPILKGINAEIYPGQITVIAGRSGCGKTTLLRNIVRLEIPTSGSIELFGHEITSYSEQAFGEVRRRIGMLFQHGALLDSISVHDNIAIPLEQHTRLPPRLITRIVDTKLNRVGLNGVTHLFPSELSGGMKKRAALARAMALDPEILFFDEPSAGLDPMTSKTLDALIIGMAQRFGITLVAVTHELTSIRRIADHILFLDDGEVRFDGTFEEANACCDEVVFDFFHADRRQGLGCVD
ncbi:MAG: ATP-binding cassette domain-containing protein [Spirochaetaceae bacterium]|nr:MAG: ATP-binding cassette domain-containing protein [Spirochaetaceae bacterium]